MNVQWQYYPREVVIQSAAKVLSLKDKFSLLDRETTTIRTKGSQL